MDLVDLELVEVGEDSMESEDDSPCSDPDYGRKNSWVERVVDNSKVKKILAIFREKIDDFKGIVKDWWAKYWGRSEAGKTRLYQVWPGKNVFFFGGRLICGPSPRGVLLTAVSIVLSSWIFVFYNGDNTSSHSSLIVGISTILTIIVLVNLFVVSTIDPGIIPRNNQASFDEYAGTSGRTRRKRVTVNGVELKLKYCRICKIYRPPRSSHCAICDNCVERFDHHCPWIGQCIALRNYRLYLAFVISALAFFAYIFAFSCRIIQWRMLQSGNGLFSMLKTCPETLALLLFSCAATGLLCGLASFHSYLIATNQTGYENFHQRYARSRNPFDKGILSNIKEVLLVPLPPSKFDFRAEVTPDLESGQHKTLV